MRGLSNVLANMLLIIITISTLSLVFLYYQGVIGKTKTELGERSPVEDCVQSANIEIIDFDGENLIIRNNGGVELNISNFHVYSMEKMYKFSYSDSDGLLKPSEEVTLKLSEPVVSGRLKVTGGCEVVDEIDLSFSSICGNGICNPEAGECDSGCPDCTISDCCGSGNCDTAIGENCSNCPSDCGSCGCVPDGDNGNCPVNCGKEDDPDCCQNIGGTWDSITNSCCDDSTDNWCNSVDGSCVGGIWYDDHCNDGTQNCDETGVDCGGSDCGSCNNPPNQPTNPIPADGATGVPTTTTLSANLTDPNGDMMNASFYWANGTLIERVTNVVSGNRAETSPLNLNPNSWWNSNWNYRKPINISNPSSSTLTDYQVLITLDTASLIFAGKMNSSCEDIRFTNFDGTTSLPYWIESGCNSANTKIWVKVDSLDANSNTTIYMYYGNSGASSASNKWTTMIPMETGQLTLSSTIDDNVVETINLAHSYKNPVVVAYIATRNGGQSIDVRIKNVGSNSFEIFEEEPDNQGHATETVNWIVTEAGSWIGTDGQLRIEAGTHSTSSVHRGGQSFDGDVINFAHSFGSTPSVLATLNTYNNGAFMSTHVHGVSTTDFTTEQEAGETGISASTETIGWIAFSRGSGSNDGIDYKVGYHAKDGDTDGVDNSAESISYSFAGKPSLIVQGCTPTGTNGYWARGAGTFSSASANFYAEEDQVGDTERGHVDTGFCWATFYPQGDLAVRKYASPEPTPTIGSEESKSKGTYEWYVNVTDGTYTTQSDTWNFTTSSGYRITQGTDSWIVKAYNGSESGSSWYPGPVAGNPNFLITIYHDDSSGTDYIIFGSESDSNRNVQLDLKQVPSGSVVTLSDDTGGAGNSRHSHDELSLNYEPEGDWGWGTCCHDGGVLELPDNWNNITIDPNTSVGVGPNLYFDGKNQNITLNKNQEITIEESP